MYGFDTVDDVLYICDAKKCGDICPGKECKHTSDITHAKNFVKGDYDSYWEKELHKDCHGCFGASDDSCQRCEEERPE